MIAMPKKEVLLKHATIYVTYLIIVWCFYRFLFKLPDDIEELIVKPVLWLVPILLLLKKEKLGLTSLGITLRNLFPAIYLSLGLGALFVMEALIINFLKYGGFNFGANIGSASFTATLGLSFATAVSEETAFRGYLFSRVAAALKNSWLANILTGIAWTAIHIPVAFFVWKMSLPAGIIYLFITAVFGLGSAFLFARTGNLASSILLHVLWEWPIILFR